MPLGLVVALAGAVILSLAAGALPIPLPRVSLALLGHPLSPLDVCVVTGLRLPRTVLGVLVGAGLDISGAALQGLFRNPLSDAGLLGVSSGAALGAVAAIIFAGTASHAVPPWAARAVLPAAAFAGGLFATLATQTLARAAGQGGVAALLLAGVAVNALASACTGLLVFTSDDRQLRDIVFWTMGSLATAGWSATLTAGIPVALAVILLLRQARPLNALLLGERSAFHLGVRVPRARRIVIAAAALAVGAGVASSGILGFVGLVVPHLVRLMAGPDHRVVLLGSALLGATLLLLADCAARTIAIPAELPVGLVTGAIGTPFFMGLLLRRRPAAS